MACALTRRRSLVGFSLALPRHLDGLPPVRAALLGARGLSHLAGLQVPEGADAPEARPPGAPLGRTARGGVRHADGTGSGGGRVPANPRARARRRRRCSRTGPVPGTARPQGTGPHGADARRSATRRLDRHDPARLRRRPDAAPCSARRRRRGARIAAAAGSPGGGAPASAAWAPPPGPAGPRPR